MFSLFLKEKNASRAVPTAFVEKELLIHIICSSRTDINIFLILKLSSLSWKAPGPLKFSVCVQSYGLSPLLDLSSLDEYLTCSQLCLSLGFWRKDCYKFSRYHCLFRRYWRCYNFKRFSTGILFNFYFFFPMPQSAGLTVCWSCHIFIFFFHKTPKNQNPKRQYKEESVLF